MAFRDRGRERPTKQEREVAKDIGGKRVPASGALRHMPGDATNATHLVDAKTTSRSFTLNATTLKKVTLEGASKGKIGMLQVEFTDLPPHMRKWAVIPWEEWIASEERHETTKKAYNATGPLLRLRTRKGK